MIAAKPSSTVTWSSATSTRILPACPPVCDLPACALGALASVLRIFTSELMKGTVEDCSARVHPLWQSSPGAVFLFPTIVARGGERLRRSQHQRTRLSPTHP